MNNSNTRVLVIHLLCIVAFLSFPLLLAKAEDGFWQKWKDPHVMRDFVGYLFTLAFFYLHYFILVPKLLLSKRYFLYTISIVISFLLTFYHPTFNPSPGKRENQFSVPPKTSGMYRPPSPPSRNYVSSLRHNSFRFSLVFFISMLIKINDRRRKAEEEKIHAELSFMKAQINPHFLFNTLNSLYDLALEKSESIKTFQWIEKNSCKHSEFPAPLR